MICTFLGSKNIKKFRGNSFFRTDCNTLPHKRKVCGKVINSDEFSIEKKKKKKCANSVFYEALCIDQNSISEWWYFLCCFFSNRPHFKYLCKSDIKMHLGIEALEEMKPYVAHCLWNSEFFTVTSHKFITNKNPNRDHNQWNLDLFVISMNFSIFSSWNWFLVVNGTNNRIINLFNQIWWHSKNKIRATI